MSNSLLDRLNAQVNAQLNAGKTYDPQADNPTDILQRADFINDLRAFYGNRDQVSFANDREAIRYYFNDRRWRNTNTVSLGRDVVDANTMDADQKARFNRLETVFQRFPNFWQEGGRGTLEALSDYVPAALLDPLNLLPAGAAARTAGAAAQAGKSLPLLRGLAAGAAVDAASNAVAGGVQDVASQVRDQELGISETYDPTRTLESAALAGTAGVVLGAGIGALPARNAARRGAAQFEAQQAADAARTAATPPPVDPNAPIIPNPADDDPRIKPGETSTWFSRFFPEIRDDIAAGIRKAAEDEDAVERARLAQTLAVYRDLSNWTTTGQQNVQAWIDAAGTDLIRRNARAGVAELYDLVYDGVIRNLPRNQIEPLVDDIIRFKRAADEEATAAAAPAANASGSQPGTKPKPNDPNATPPEAPAPTDGAPPPAAGAAAVPKEATPAPTTEAVAAAPEAPKPASAGITKRKQLVSALVNIGFDKKQAQAISGRIDWTNADKAALAKQVDDTIGDQRALAEAKKFVNQADEYARQLAREGYSSSEIDEAVAELASKLPENIRPAFKKLKELFSGTEGSMADAIVERVLPNLMKAARASVKREDMGAFEAFARNAALGVLNSEFFVGAGPDRLRAQIETRADNIVEEFIARRSARNQPKFEEATDPNTPRVLGTKVSRPIDSLPDLPQSELAKLHAEGDQRVAKFERDGKTVYDWKETKPQRVIDIFDDARQRAAVDPEAMAAINAAARTRARERQAREARVRANQARADGADIEGLVAASQREYQEIYDKEYAELGRSITISRRKVGETEVDGKKVPKFAYAAIPGRRYISSNEVKARIAAAEIAEERRLRAEWDSLDDAGRVAAKLKMIGEGEDARIVRRGQRGLMNFALQQEELRLRKKGGDPSVVERDGQYFERYVRTSASPTVVGPTSPRIEVEWMRRDTKTGAFSTNPGDILTLVEAVKRAHASNRVVEFVLTRQEANLWAAGELFDKGSAPKTVLVSPPKPAITDVVGEAGPVKPREAQPAIVKTKDGGAGGAIIVPTESATSPTQPNVYYYDPQSRGIYADPANAPPRIVDEATAIVDGIEDPKVADAVAADIKANPTRPSAKDRLAQLMAPVQKSDAAPIAVPEGRVFAVMGNDGKNMVVRALSPAQVAQLGGDMTNAISLLVKDPAKHKDWKIGSVPAGTKTFQVRASNRDLFTPIGETPKGPAADTPADSFKPLPKFSEVSTTQVQVGNRSMTVDEAFRRAVELEQGDITPASIDELIELHQAIPEFRSDNFNKDRQKTIWTLANKILVDPANTTDERDIIVGMIHQVADRVGVAPRIKEADDGINRFVETGDAMGIIKLSTKNDSGPAFSRVTHELGHWMWRNALAPQDRVQFLSHIKSAYTSSPEGMAKLKQLYMRDPRTKSLAELFANQYELAVNRVYRGEVSSKYWEPYLKAAPELANLARRALGDDASVILDETTAGILHKFLSDKEVDTFGKSAGKTSASPAAMSAVRVQQHYDIAFDELSRALKEASLGGDEAGVREILTSRPFTSPAVAKGAGNPNGIKALLYGFKTVGGPNPQLYWSAKRMSAAIHMKYVDEQLAAKEISQAAADKARAKFDDLMTREIGGETENLSDVADDMLGTANMASGTRDVLEAASIGTYDALERMTWMDLGYRAQAVLSEIRAYQERAYNRAHKARMPATIVPEKPAAEKSTPIGERVAATIKDNARLAAAEKAVNEIKAAQEAMATSRNARGKPTKAESPDVKSPAAMSDAELSRELATTDKNGDRHRQAAAERVRREKAKPPKVDAAPTLELSAMDDIQLGLAFGEARNSGDPERIGTVYAEILRRKSPPKIQNAIVQDAIERNIAESAGVEISDGIPANAPTGVQAILEQISWRTAEETRAGRDFAKRLLDLVRGPLRNAAEDTFILDQAALYRLAGEEIPAGSQGAFVDFTDPANMGILRKFSRQAATAAIGLTKGTSTPLDAMHEVLHLATRALDAETSGRILDAYRGANDPIKDVVVSAYAGKSEMQQAIEWFIDGGVKHFAERIAKGDIYRHALENGTLSLEMKGWLERTLDTLREYAAYLINGLVGRNDVKQMYRQLFFYGDLHAAKRGRDTLDPALMSTTDGAVAAARARITPERRAKIDEYAAGGMLSDDEGRAIMVYHGTVDGEALNGAGAIMRASSYGDLGPGTYITDSKRAGKFYSEHPTMGAWASLIEDSSLPENQKNGLMRAARELVDAERALLDGRGDEAPEVLREVIAEARAMLAEAGIKPKSAVIPGFGRITNGLDFRRTKAYPLAELGADTPMGNFLERLAELYPEVDDALAARAGDGFLAGDDLFMGLMDGVARGMSTDGKTPHPYEVTEAIQSVAKSAGYDGMGITMRATDAGGDFEFDAYSIFDAGQFKAHDAKEFDPAKPELRNALTLDRSMSFSAALAEGMGGRPKIENAMNLAQSLEKIGVSPTDARMVANIFRGKVTDESLKAAASQSGVQIQTNASRISKFVSRWLGDRVKPVFEETDQLFGRIYGDIENDLNKLPGNETLGRFFRGMKFWGEVPVIEAERRIGDALRSYGRDPAKLAALTKDERAIYNKIRGSLDKMYDRLKDAGIPVGKRENYWPQIWDAHLLERNRDEAVRGFARYYMMEARHAENAMRPLDEAEAYSRAANTVDRIISENGVYVPGAENFAGSQSEHLDHSRLIELEKPWARDANAMLSKFMVQDARSIFVKYTYEAARKLAFVERFGVKGHMVDDYLNSRLYGRGAVAEMLANGRETQKRYRAVEGGDITDRRFQLEIGRAIGQERAVPLTDELYAIAKGAGTEQQKSARITDAIVAATGKEGPNSRRRAEAIARGIIENPDGAVREMEVNPDELRFLESFMNRMQGQPAFSGPGMNALRDVSHNIRALNNITLLGLTTLTSLTDPALIMARTYDFKAYTKGLAEYFKGASSSDIQMMRNIGLSAETVLHEALGGIEGRGMATRLTNAFFKANLLTPWTKTTRELAGVIGWEGIKAAQRDALSNIDGRGIANLKYRKAARFLRDLGLDEYVPTVDNRGVKSIEAAGLNDDTIRRAVLRFANESIFSPNSNDIPLFFADNPIGQIMWQLKSFPMQAGRLAKHVISRAGEGDVGPLVYVLSIGTGLSVGVNVLKDYALARGGEKGEDPERSLRDRSLNKLLAEFGFEDAVGEGKAQEIAGWYIQSLLGLGVTGLIFDTLYNYAQQADNGAFGAQRTAGLVFGPSASLFFDAFNVGQGLYQLGANAITGEEENAKMRSAMRTIVSRTPVVGGFKDVREGVVDATAGEAQ